MPHRRISDPQRLYALIDEILLIEAHADLDVLMRRIVDGAVDLVGARYGALGVIDVNGTGLREFITEGVSERECAAIGEPPVGKGLLGAVIEGGRPIRVDDLGADPLASGFPSGHPVMRRFLGVPVRLGNGEVFGNLYLCDREDGAPFSDEDEAVVDALGRAAGLIITEASLRAKVHELTINEERARLARDLHDTVIQHLFAVGLGLQATSGLSMSDEARDRVLQSIDDLDATIREIRTTIFEISLDRSSKDNGLRARILALVDEVASRLNLPVAVEFLGPIDAAIGSVCADHVTNAVRELLANVVRHAQATRAVLRFSVTSGMAALVVEDDGLGLGSFGPTGHGLENLAERARLVGGDCTFAERPGGGTAVTWTATWLR